MVACLRGIRNEIAVDEYAIRVAGAPIVHIPRPGKWMSILQPARRPRVARAVAAIGRLAWTLGGDKLFFAIQALRLLRGYRNRGAPGLPPFGVGSTALVTSSRASELLTHEAIRPRVSSWIVFPWIPYPAPAPDRTATIDALCLVAREELPGLWRDACRVSSHLRKDRARRCWQLQSYTAFHWLVSCAASEAAPGSLVTCEHIDRWAVLADHASASIARRGLASSLSLMQHGHAGPLDDKEPPLSVPFRLRRVQDLFCYGPDAGEALQSLALDPRAARPALHFFKPTIRLTNMSGDRPAILFVGHPFCEPFQQRVAELIRAQSAVEILYKPHPAVKDRQQARGDPWTVIRYRTEFPKVKLIVSYPSTLVTEYSVHGVDAILHPIHPETEDPSEYAENALARLRRLDHETRG